jgi:uncharacterized membrane protein YfbV (UPF0208 family)
MLCGGGGGVAELSLNSLSSATARRQRAHTNDVRATILQDLRFCCVSLPLKAVWWDGRCFSVTPLQKFNRTGN